MSDFNPAVITAFATAFVLVLGGIGAFYKVIREIGKVHAATNSMKDELVESVTAASLKKGFREALDLITAQLAAGVPLSQISKAAELEAANERYNTEAASDKARNQDAARIAAGVIK